MQNPELPGRRIAISAAAIAGTVLAAVVIVLLWLHARHVPPGGPALQRPYTLAMPAPALQSAPQPDLSAYLAEKMRQLHGRGWVDRTQGLAHIPIEDAMALLATRAASAPEGGP